ncbi:MAG TPA: hypothetical protein VM935_19065 [Chitinophagaceae bacterium]|jgi:hypothetical protein|nr:hypothetical protein [Chitinophagaceae bacterium]
MNSKQINFFLAPNDLNDVAVFFKEKGCHILKRRVDYPTNRVDYDFVSNKEEIFQVYIYSSPFTDKIEFQYLEEEQYYYVDSLRSFCIEFGIGGFYPYSDKELHRSRFYYVHKYYNTEGILISKEKKFINWADNIFKEFRKYFLTLSQDFKGVYFSDKALELTKNYNAKLVNGGLKFVFASSVNLAQD